MYPRKLKRSSLWSLFLGQAQLNRSPPSQLSIKALHSIIPGICKLLNERLNGATYI
ncbi:hypothetical protein DU19_0035 [Chlamydia muridarum]|nr:hypothetical protein DU17_0035 [Chlamydia muridarum]KDU81026.1 hypothetical protein DU18_0036 [Chlamydia muridarum]KDU82477.1 hypothetical protein DU19_0035 [Chlamydia muridarum]KDU82978.1 hypothetical protein DU20_0035 [Chlamydia muridarum]KDU84870.1 hypothetical protein DU21_0035 [Chlamydia muridarum]